MAILHPARGTASASRLRLCLPAVAAIAMAVSGCGKDDEAAIEAARPPSDNYKYGRTISFAAKGMSHRYTVTGWADVEPDHTWTNGVSATLRFKVRRTSGAVVLNMTMHGFTRPPEVPYQPVDISVNGEKIGRWNVDDLKVYAVVIPAKFVATREPRLTIDFQIPKATAPADAGLHSDFRRLGLCVQKLVLYAVGDNVQQLFEQAQPPEEEEALSSPTPEP